MGSSINYYVSTTCLQLHPNSSSFKCKLGAAAATMSPAIPKAPQQKAGEDLRERIRKEMVRSSNSNPVKTMELIDSTQRLGIGYHFEEEIKLLLERYVDSDMGLGDNLYATALRFRLLRHNGLTAHSDVFSKFIDEKNGKLIKDTWGLLSLYEASWLGSKGEVELLDAMEFTKTHLQNNPNVIISQALEVPRHLRMTRLESRNYIHQYGMEPNHNLHLLDFAKFDFNSVQSLHRNELDNIIRWWKELGLIDKLGFGRDRPLECYLWTVGIFPEPYNSNCRIQLTKTIAILLVIDDIFDTYGSMPDLLLFTHAIKRWDLNAMESLPEYMKICYMALYNTTNDIAYMILKQHGWNVVPHLKRTWIDMFEAFLTEAKWCKDGYVPKLQEYLINGVTTGGTYMALVHSFFLLGKGVNNHTLSMLKPYPNLFSISGKILRLWDDLGTAREEQERGDVASSIDCCIRERAKGISSCEEEKEEEEEEGRKEVRKLIRGLWRELNGEMRGLWPISMMNASFNLARTAQVVYQHGDDGKASCVDDQVQALLYQPLYMP
ncbi:probable terpene synthase 11 isoform X1 [Euphorbia lathyris]|uniref:probable terpene synthase 11 isoform X1 n=1 Tax=Euphorbia lathyris TaxID=212925 RepID=UPI0033135559